MSTTELSQSSQPSYTISPARTTTDIDAIRTLLQTFSYGQIEKQIQALSAESASLPGRFSLPHGEMLLARTLPPDYKPIGWIGLRPFPELSDPEASMRNTDVCEAKRLFVEEEYRGMGIGKALVRARSISPCGKEKRPGSEALSAESACICFSICPWEKVWRRVRIASISVVVRAGEIM